MNQQQQNNYNQLIPDIDIAYNQENNARLIVLMGYNQAITEVLHSIRDSALPSLEWAHNRIAVIELDSEKSDAQFNAIETIVGKFTRLYGEAKTRVQLALRNQQDPDNNDQNILDSKEFFDIPERSLHHG